MRRFTGRTKFLVLAVTVTVGAVLASSGSAAAGKAYSASITPNSAPAGLTTSFAYTVTNRDAQQPLGSFRVAIPAGWVVSGATITSAPVGKPWSLTPNTISLGYIEAKANNNNARLSKDQAVVVSFSGKAPCGGGPFVFQSAAHQANLFQGPNNEFVQTNADSFRTVALSGGGGGVASVSIDPVGTPQTAGTPFSVTVRTFDGCGNATSGAASATLSGFNASPAPVNKPMDVALNTDDGSSATFNVTAYRAETASLTATVGSKTSAPSNAITVNHATFALSFATQPGAAEVGQPIPSTTPPAPVTVHVADVYGNLAPDGMSVTMTAPSVLAGTLTDGTSAGDATFANLSIGAVGTYRLTARLDGSSPEATATSDVFGIVNDLQNCTDVSLCQSTAGNGKQTTSSKITTSSSFQNVVLTTSFLDASASRCAGFTTVPGTQLSDVSIESGNVVAARPEFTITLIIPKQTLQAAGFTQRSAASFDACTGVKWIDPSTPVVPWTTKSGSAATLVDNFYWGLTPECSGLPSASINPCVLLKTKNESELRSVVGTLPPDVRFKSGDLALVVRVRFGWDGRLSIGG